MPTLYKLCAFPVRKWECASPGMHILTGNGDVPHWECTSSPRMHIVYIQGDVISKISQAHEMTRISCHYSHLYTSVYGSVMAVFPLDRNAIMESYD